MANVSSSTTIILKIFFPVFWIAFFGMFSISLLLSDFDYIGGLPAWLFKVVWIGFTFFGIFVMYITVMNLKRVEMDDHFLYATNYRTTYRYPWHNVERLEESNYFLFKILTVHLKEAGTFGKKISFVPGRHNLKDFMAHHPRVAEQFEEKEVEENG